MSYKTEMINKVESDIIARIENMLMKGWAIYYVYETTEFLYVTFVSK